MSTPPLPLRATVQRFRSDDLDEVVEFLGSRYGAHTRIAVGKGPLNYDITMLGGAHGAMGLRHLGVPNVLQAAVPVPTLHFALDASAEYRIGRRSLRATRDTAVLLAPGHAYTMRAPAGSMIAVMLDPELLRRQLRCRQRDRADARALRSLEIMLPRSRTADIVRHLSVHMGHDGAGMKASYALDEICARDRELHAWVANRVLEDAGILSASADSLQVAEDIETWIRRHLAEPITLERLASVAGVSNRCLQKACMARWGRSPMDLVASLRLQRSHVRLASRSPGLTVTQAAVESGFTHLGRFAVMYREVFGESPSDTLAG